MLLLRITGKPPYRNPIKIAYQYLDIGYCCFPILEGFVKRWPPTTFDTPSVRLLFRQTMAWATYLPDSRIKWTSGTESCPIWPSEPDVSVITAIAAEALAVPTDTLSVRFLSDGANHKVYDVTQNDASITCPGHIFRVAVPIDPVYKMESEMATLEFLRQKTTIPVPRPVAWNSCATNPLGYEWALLEKVPGVELRSVWEEIPWAKKVDIAETIATYLDQIWSPDLRFPQIGSLYCATFIDREPFDDSAATPTESPSFSMSRVDAATRFGFKIGPAVDSDFFSGRRRYLTSDRGPYASSRDWLAALINIEIEFIRTAKQLMKDQHTKTAQHQVEDEDDLADEIGIDEDDDPDFMLNLCDKYLHTLPLVFPHAKDGDEMEEVDSRFFLHHLDLRGANILVDPETSEITGIIDWEKTCTMPEWYGLNYPMLLNKMDPHSPRPSDSDVAALGEGRVPDDMIDIQRDNLSLWEAKDLREIFDSKLQQLGYSKDWRPVSPQDDLKSSFIRGVGNLSDFWERAANRMRNIEKKLQDHDKVELVANYRGAFRCTGKNSILFGSSGTRSCGDYLAT